MADVFLSYKRDERAAVETIASRLRDLGLTVWFDASLSAGETFNAEIDREARAARAILVCWSPAARESEWVNAEAMIGFEQKKLATCYVAGPDHFSAPTPFNTSHAEDLRAWLTSPSVEHLGWKSVLRRIGKLCERTDIESWGALGSEATANEINRWIAKNRASPLLMAANRLLYDSQSADEGTNARRETLVHSERRPRERTERVTRGEGRWGKFEWIAGATAGAVALFTLVSWATQQTVASKAENSSTAEPSVSELSCAVFAGVTEANLRQRFGDESVTHEILNAPEGETYDATILHLPVANSVARIEIVWNEETGHPLSVATSGTSSLRGPNGLTLGMSAADVQRINGRPFSIYNWGWDYGGYVYDWQGGNLDRGACRVIGGFEARGPDTSAVDQGGQGETRFQSDSVAIRGANVHLVWFGLRFD